MRSRAHRLEEKRDGDAEFFRITAFKGGVVMRRKVGLFFMCGVVLPLAFATTASAQVDVSPKDPKPGDTVTVKSFGGFSGSGGTVSIHLSARSSPGVTHAPGTTSDPLCEEELVPGCILKSTAPDPRGSVDTSFTVPAGVEPGPQLLVLSQRVALNGRQRGFSPLRARINVQSAAGAVTPGGRGGLPGLPPGLLAMGSALLLLATGATLTARRLRTLNRPQLGS